MCEYRDFFITRYSDETPGTQAESSPKNPFFHLHLHQQEPSPAGYTFFNEGEQKLLISAYKAHKTAAPEARHPKSSRRDKRETEIFLSRSVPSSGACV